MSDLLIALSSPFKFRSARGTVREHQPLSQELICSYDQPERAPVKLTNKTTTGMGSKAHAMTAALAKSDSGVQKVVDIRTLPVRSPINCNIKVTEYESSFISLYKLWDSYQRERVVHLV